MDQGAQTDLRFVEDQNLVPLDTQSKRLLNDRARDRSHHVGHLISEIFSQILRQTIENEHPAHSVLPSQNSLIHIAEIVTLVPG